MRISSLSTEFYRVNVTATVAGVPYDPTGDRVEFAFTAPGTAAPSTWIAGSWQTIVGTPTRYCAQCLVGPGVGGTVLGLGDWLAWVRITDAPEIPVRQVGTLTVT